MDKHKEFFKDVYADTWIKSVSKYGVGEFEQYLLDLFLLSINKNDVNKVLEVSIGTGYPFGEYISKLNNVDFYGLDINRRLLEIAYSKCSNLKSIIADSECIPFKNGTFDITYCFRSTFFFKNAEKAIREMIRITKNGGAIIFDIQNADSPFIIYSITKAKIKLNIFEKPLNKLKLLLRKNTKDRFIYTIPISAKRVEKILLEERIKEYKVGCFNLKGKFISDKLNILYPKIVFCLKK